MISVNGYKGLYIVYDGIVGCGKSAQIARLKEVLPEDFPGIDIIFTYEPGGNPEADKIRDRVKHEKMSPLDEVMLFAQSRSITLPEIVRPALERGGLVVSDRSFTTSLDYQGIGRGVGLDEVWRINEPIVKNTFPDLLVIPRVGLEASMKRSSGDRPDKFDEEGINFIQTCFDGYPYMTEFLHKISTQTRIVQIDDHEGKIGIDEMGKEIEMRLYPFIESWINEGGVVRERQR